MNARQELESAYINLLNESYHIFKNDNGELLENLSNLFLPSINHEYSNAKNKIMIIGRETRDWNTKSTYKISDVKNYVKESMDYHEGFLSRRLSETNSKGRSFHHFTRNIAKKTGEEGIIYSNLFCFSSKETLPKKSKVFDEIITLSEKIIRAQIRILKPDIIIFANGFDSTSLKIRRKFFPIDGPQNVCLNPKSYQEEYGISNKQLWSFELSFEGRSIQAYRTYHPSAISKDAFSAHNFLIDLLPKS
ncbi:hypothetical protein ACUM5Y_06775 [Marinomonas dokdonensis]|uniref:hypothetical protein n=1 Tax=Marinomonas dokdonensis TaxID=328224 RepID=UPI00405553ED